MEMNETSMSIGSLASELEHVANNVWSRLESLGDALGGSSPKPTDGAKQPVDDLHSSLQRTLTALRESQDQLLRCEKLVGVAPSTPTEGAKALVGQLQGQQLRRY